MTYEVSQQFFFDAAHTLDRQIEAEGSRRIHGHTYQAEVALRGRPDPATGMVIDLGLVRLALGEVREQLDHHLLDEVAGLGKPTLENLCAFIARYLQSRLPGLHRVKVWRAGMQDACTLYLDGSGAR